MIFKNKGYKSFTHLLFSTTLLFFGLLGCSSNQPKSKPEFTTLTIGILSSSDYYEGLTDYLKREFGNKVQIIIDGGDKLSYEEARKRMINREWDISFTLSPMLSIAAKNNGYTHTGRMFPKNDPYYQAVLFTKADSPIKSISDLNETHTIALGDFNSVSSFYVASRSVEC